MITRRRLVNMGATDTWIHEHVEPGHLTRVHHGVYVIGDPVLTLDQRELAAVLACGPGAALSHRSAARNRRIPFGTQGPIEVTAPTNRRVPGMTVHRCRSFSEADWSYVDGVPCITVRRTLIDLAGELDRAGLAAAVGQARFRHQIGPADRETVRRDAAGRKGSRELLLLLGTDEELKSELERRFRRLLRRAGILLPDTNEFLTVAGITYEIDCYWPEHSLCVELDSRLHHGQAWQRERDTRRDTKLTIAGYRVIRISWAHLHAEPDDVLRDLRNLLGCPG